MKKPTQEMIRFLKFGIDQYAAILQIAVAICDDRGSRLDISISDIDGILGVYKNLYPEFSGDLTHTAVKDVIRILIPVQTQH